MIRTTILVLCLTALALSTSSCNLPCGEWIWKKRQSCEDTRPAW